MNIKSSHLSIILGATVGAILFNTVQLFAQTETFMARLIFISVCSIASLILLGFTYLLLGKPKIKRTIDRYDTYNIINATVAISIFLSGFMNLWTAMLIIITVFVVPYSYASPYFIVKLALGLDNKKL